MIRVALNCAQIGNAGGVDSIMSGRWEPTSEAWEARNPNRKITENGKHIYPAAGESDNDYQPAALIILPLSADRSGSVGAFQSEASESPYGTG